MKKRSLEYEKRFRKYIYSFDLETHKEICKNINVKPNIEEQKVNNKFEKGFKILIKYFDSIADEEKLKVDKQLKKLGL